MRLNKTSLILVTLLAGLFLFLGCQKQPEGKKPIEVKVAFWGGPDEVMIINDIIAKWQKSHPGIKVRLEHTPYRGYVDKLLTRIAGRSAPDIICTEVDLFVTFQSKAIEAR